MKTSVTQIAFYLAAVLVTAVPSHSQFAFPFPQSSPTATNKNVLRSSDEHLTSESQIIQKLENRIIQIEKKVTRIETLLEIQSIELRSIGNTLSSLVSTIEKEKNEREMRDLINRRTR